mgnify:CR=1 FL=1
MPIYSIPMELHVLAKSPEEALSIAYSRTDSIDDKYGDGPHSLHVATDDTDDIDLVEDYPNGEYEIVDTRVIAGAELADGGPIEIHDAEGFVSAHPDYESANKALQQLRNDED